MNRREEKLRGVPSAARYLKIDDWIFEAPWRSLDKDPDG
jgi:hypothetical protein